MAFTDVDIKRMKENGTIDFFLDLTSFISKHIKENYPLSKEDIASIIDGKPTDHVKRRNEAIRILQEERDQIIKEIEENYGQTEIDFSQEYSVQDYNNDISKMKERMLGRLKKELDQQHDENQPVEEQEVESEQVEPTEEQLGDEIKEKMGITADEIKIMEEKGILPYYCDLANFVLEFLGDDLSDEFINAEEAKAIMTEEMNKGLKEINKEWGGNLPGRDNLWYSDYIQKIKKNIYGRYLDIKFNHYVKEQSAEKNGFGKKQEEPAEEQKFENGQRKPTGEQLVEEVVEESQERRITPDEIRSASSEINTEMGLNHQQLSDVEKSIGE